MPRKSLAVLVAAALALVVSAAAYLGLHSAQQGADNNARLTSVYVVKGNIPRNESASAAYLQGLITTTRLPLQFVPAGAVTDLSRIRNHEALYNVPAGEIVLDSMFVAPLAGTSLAAQTVPKGDVAVSVAVDQVHGVAGLIQPGDKVDILVNLDGDQEIYLYQLVPVLAVGTALVSSPHSAQTASPTTGSSPLATAATPQTKVVITFAATRAQAATIALASGGGGVAGGLDLALVAPGDKALPVTSISGTNLVPGSPGASVSNPAPTSVSSGGHVSRSETDENTP